ncbi:MAG: hypothetical protein M1434_14330 [Chloroflexi bacterium]|nr:hypothetical protein [Chloroflexota bacterium]MCL5275896.1 hypothetical protein [Chloroflexota bacterium]
MSYRRALDAINLRPTDRAAHQENLDHPAFMRELIGYDPWTDPQQAYIDAYKALDVDWIFGVPQRAIRFEKGQSSRAGEDGVRYTEWGLSGSSWREEFPFTDVEAVLNYDPRVPMNLSAYPFCQAWPTSAMCRSSICAFSLLDIQRTGGYGLRNRLLRQCRNSCDTVLIPSYLAQSDRFGTLAGAQRRHIATGWNSVPHPSLCRSCVCLARLRLRPTRCKTHDRQRLWLGENGVKADHE